jgi:hypothetical protein
MFEKASRLRLRFQYKGLISTEDLWDLKLESLDEIYKNLNKQLQETESESLLSRKSDNLEPLRLKIEIVKHVFTTRLQEIESKQNQIANAQHKQKLMEALENKQQEKLLNMSEEDLKKELEKY